MSIEWIWISTACAIVVYVNGGAEIAGRENTGRENATQNCIIMHYNIIVKMGIAHKFINVTNILTPLIHFVLKLFEWTCI